MTPIQAAQARTDLLDRRDRLATAAVALPTTEQLQALLNEVDAALARLDAGKFGLCDTCHDPIEADRLAANPLTRFCLDHLTPAEQKALEQDLDLAAKIQSQLLPSRELVVDGWEASYHYEPHGPAGGDCCDLLPQESGDLHILLGDVMGKGLAASMLMAHLQAIFRSLAMLAMPIPELMARANRVFAQSTGGSTFATLFYGRAHPTGELEYCNAGHCPPLVSRQGHVESLQPTGLPLGLFAGAPYASASLRLAPGELLLLYTDGVSEARSADGHDYGTRRLERLMKTLVSRPGRELVAASLADLDAFRGPARSEDDVTLLVLLRTTRS